MAILRRFTPQVQPISIDEAFLDVTALAGPVRRRRADRPADQGRGPRRGRPDRLGRRGGDEAGRQDRLRPAQARRAGRGAAGRGGGVPGAAADLAPVGRRREDGGRPAEYGVRTIGDLAALPTRRARAAVRQHGASLVARAHGIDPDPVATGEPAKSIGHEHTFDVDTSDPRGHRADAAGHGRRRGVAAARGRAQGGDDHDQAARQRASRRSPGRRRLDVPADLTEPIYEAALACCGRELHGQRIRLVGVTASNFRDREQLALFGVEDPRRHQAAEALDTDPTQVRRPGGHAGAARACRAACAASSGTR